MGELFTFYEAFRGARDVSLAVPRPYGDHVAWVEGEIAATRERAAAYWRLTLAGFTAPTPLPSSAPEVGPPRGPQLLGEDEIRLSRA